MRWLLVLVLLLGVAFAALLIALFQFEKLTWGPLLETLVERGTGRAFKISGDLDARAGRIVSVRAERISLGNADWGGRERMLVIDGVLVSIDLARLLDGLLVIDEVRVTGAELVFEQDARGRSNWAMEGGGQEQPATTERLAAVPLLIERAELLDLNITVASPAMTHPLTVRLDSVTQQAGAQNQLNAALVGAIDDRPVKLRARIEPFTQLLAARAVDFKIHAELDALTMDAEGQLDDLLQPKQPTVQLTAAAPQVADVLAMFALPENLAGELQLSASMLPVADHHEIDVAGFVGPFQLDVQARLRELGALDDAALDFEARGPDLAAATELVGVSGLPAQPFDVRSRLAITGGRMRIDELSLRAGANQLTVSGVMNQFPQLENSDVRLELAGADYLEFAGLLGLDPANPEPAPYSLRASLEYSSRDVQTFSAHATLGDINGEFRGRLTEYPRFIGSRLDYFVTGPDSAVILRAFDRPPLLQGSYVLKGEIGRTETGFSIESAALSLVDNELRVSGTVGNEPLGADTNLSARYVGPDLARIVTIAGYTGFVPAGDGEITVNARAQDKRIRFDDLAVKLGRNRLQAAGSISLGNDLAGTRVNIALRGEDVADVLPDEASAYVDAGQAFDIAGEVAMQSSGVAIETLTANVGGVRLDGSGRVGLAQPLSDAEFSIDLRGGDLAAVIPPQFRQTYPFPQAAFAVSGDGALTREGLALQNVKATVGDDRLALSGLVPLRTPFDGMRLKVAMEGPDLAALLPSELAQWNLEETPYKVSGAASLADDILSVKGLDMLVAKAELRGDLGVSLKDPRAFGQFDLEGRGGNLAALIPQVPNYRPPALPYALEARGGWDLRRVAIDKAHVVLEGTRIDLAGEVDLPPNMTATRLTLSARGPKLTDLGEVAGVELPLEPFSVAASLEGSTDSLAMPKLDLRVGESDVRGSLAVALAEKPTIDAVLDSELLDFVKLLPPEEEATADSSAPEPAPRDGRVIPDIPVPAEQLQLVDLNARITVGEVRMHRNTFHDVAIDATLRNGDLNVRRLRASAVEGNINASFRATATGKRITTRGSLQGVGIQFGKGETSTAAGPPLPKQDLRVTFDTSGATTRELAANLNGHAEITGATGRVKNSASLLFGDFASELLATINPYTKKEPYTTIACSAVYADIVNGMVTINPGAVLQTDKLNVFARGQLDLKSERIGLRFNTSARTGIGVSVAGFVNPFVGVSGTLAKPSLRLNRDASTVLEGGVAYATGGASIIAKGLFDRWFGAKDPCERLAQEAQKKSQPETDTP